jgi:DNA-binding transcriptional ArsR family regulator
LALNEREWQTGRIPLKERTKQPVEAMTHALNHWVRLEAVAIFHQGEFSAGEVAEMMGEDVRYVTGHIRILYEAGCIEFVGLKRIGGHARPVFRAVVLPVITDEVFRAMSKDERHDANGAIVQGFLTESLSSYRNDKMDGAEEPPCLIWDAPPLDAEGRQKLRERLTEIWEDEVLAVQAESANRIAESGEEAIPTVIGLFSFERGRQGRPEKGYYRAEKN